MSVFLSLLTITLWACPSPPALQEGPRPGSTEGQPPPPPDGEIGGPQNPGTPDGPQEAQRVPLDALYPESQDEEAEERPLADQYAIHDGEYLGEMLLTGTTVGGEYTEETGQCAMQLTFDHTEIEHEMRGTFTCTSDETSSSNFAKMHLAFGEGKLFGGIIDGAFRGEFWYGPVNGTWTADLTGGHTLTGGWSDRYVATDSIPQLPSFDHRGQFTLERQ